MMGDGGKALRKREQEEIDAGCKKSVNYLMIINCYYNYRIDDDGKCHCNECGFNTDPLLAERIRREGCMFYENSPVKEKREAEGERNNK